MRRCQLGPGYHPGTVTPHDLRRLALALTAVGLCCVLPIALGAPVDLLLAAPVLLLALPLLSGGYVGEELLQRFARSGASGRPRRRARAAGLPARPARTLVPRGGALIAASLAVRPPPLAATVR